MSTVPVISVLPDRWSRPLRVLLVDDQPIVGESLRRMLADEEDFEFHYCADATQAIPTANRIQPTVILQDLVMPEVDGLLADWHTIAQDEATSVVYGMPRAAVELNSARQVLPLAQISAAIAAQFRGP